MKQQKRHEGKEFGVPNGGWEVQLGVVGALGPKASGPNIQEKNIVWLKREREKEA